jgi:hypothetical protein
MPDLKVEIDGVFVSLAACCWVVTKPCGCIASVMTAAFGDEAFATKEQALKEMWPLKKERDRYTRPGWEIQLITFEDYKVRYGDPDAWKCPHTKQKAAS